jgi:hypothetical protein
MRHPDCSSYTFAWIVKVGAMAVIDPQGKEIIGMDWPAYEYRQPGFIVGGERDASGALMMGAIYDTSGKLLLHTQSDACNQRQIVTGGQKIVWPKRLKTCRR